MNSVAPPVAYEGTTELEAPRSGEEEEEEEEEGGGASALLPSFLPFSLSPRESRCLPSAPALRGGSPYLTPQQVSKVFSLWSIDQCR